MKFNIINYLLKEGVRNIFKNKKSTFSAILVMCISMLIFGLFFTIGENINHIMKNIEDSQALRVFIKKDATEEEIANLKIQISNIEGVNKATFVSKQQALESLEEDYGDKAYLLSGYEKNNFLPDSYVVTLTDLKLASNVKTSISQLDKVEEITSKDETMAKLVSIVNMIRLVTLAILVGLIIASIFIISNTIKLTVYARRREISIMKYVGATNSFIRWPFVVEGIIIGIISAAISILVVGISYKLITIKLLETTFIQNLGVSLVAFSDMFNLILIVYLALGIGIGTLGSIMSMKKYLEV